MSRTLGAVQVEIRNVVLEIMESELTDACHGTCCMAVSECSLILEDITFSGHCNLR
jgi:hypothetical protein